MKKIINVNKGKTARTITIPSDYFKIHEHRKAAIVAFDFVESDEGIITLTPVREQPVIHQRNSIPPFDQPNNPRFG